MGQLEERYKNYRVPQEYMKQGVYPYFREITSKQATEVEMAGHKVLMFGSNAYTGLTGDERVIEAAKKALDKYSSIGIAIPGGRFSIRDVDDNEIVKPDTDGELVYFGDNVCMGYAEKPEDLSKGDENHGILHTGDVAKRDRDGYYYITGRMKRFVKMWGNRVNLDTIEQLVKPLTTNCACVGDDNKITVFLTDSSCEKKVITFLAEKTKLNTRAFEIKVLGEIPTKASGKIDYSQLKKLLDL